MRMLSFAFSVIASLAAAQSVETPSRLSVTPADRNADAWWRERFEAKDAITKKGGIDLVFLGDSITQGWEAEGQAVWEQHFAKRRAANLGFSGDRTQNALWRVENGHFSETNPPKLVVVMIGTNNSGPNGDSASQIADGITAVVGALRKKLPQTKVLLLGIFPRGKSPNPQRSECDVASRRASSIADDRWVRYFDIGTTLMERDGTISKEVMPDLLHLSAKGYAIWADAIEPVVKEMLGEA